VLGGLRIGPGGPGLATAAEERGPGARPGLGRPARGATRPAAGGGAPGGNIRRCKSAGAAPRAAAAAQGPAPGVQPTATSAPSGASLLLIGGIANRRDPPRAARAAGCCCAAGAGCRPCHGCRSCAGPAISGTWLAGGFVGLAVVLIVAHAVVQPSGGATTSNPAEDQARLTTNANLDPGLDLSAAAAPAFTLTDQFGPAPYR